MSYLGDFAIQSTLHPFLHIYALFTLIFTSTNTAKCQMHIKCIKVGESQMSAFLTTEGKDHIFRHKC